jgi:hypothetical protein
MKNTKFDFIKIRAWIKDNISSDLSDKDVLYSISNYIKQTYNPHDFPKITVSSVLSNEDPKFIRFIDINNEKVYFN